MSISPDTFARTSSGARNAPCPSSSSCTGNAASTTATRRSGPRIAIRPPGSSRGSSLALRRESRGRQSIRPQARASPTSRSVFDGLLLFWISWIRMVWSAFEALKQENQEIKRLGFKKPVTSPDGRDASQVRRASRPTRTARSEGASGG